MESKISVAKELDYQTKINSSPLYRYQIVTQSQGGGNTVSLNQSSTQLTYFDLPPEVVWNASKSFFTWQITYPTAAAANYTVAYMDIPPIRRIRLQTRGQKVLCEINNFQYYWKMCSNLTKWTDEFNSLSTGGYGATLAAATANGVWLYDNPSNALPSTAIAGNTPNGAKVYYSGGWAVDNTTVFRRAYQTQLQLAMGAAEGAFTMNCHLNLGMIPFSFFSVNRDFYSTESLQMLVEWESYDNFCWFSVGGAPITAPISVSGVGAPTVANYLLYTAVESNPVIANEMRSKVLSSGFSQLIPYPTFVQLNLPANATSGSVQFRINRANGIRLLRILSAEAISNSSLSTRCNFYNNEGLITQDYYTSLNTQRLQQSDCNNANGTDWVYNEKYFRDTPFSNYQEWTTQCPVHVDDFSGIDSLADANEYDLNVCGIDLSVEQLWTKFLSSITNLSAVGGVQENFVIVCQANLVSSATGVDILL